MVSPPPEPPPTELVLTLVPNGPTAAPTAPVCWPPPWRGPARVDIGCLALSSSPLPGSGTCPLLVLGAAGCSAGRGHGTSPHHHTTRRDTTRHDTARRDAEDSVDCTQRRLTSRKRCAPVCNRSSHRQRRIATTARDHSDHTFFFGLRSSSTAAHPAQRRAALFLPWRVSIAGRVLPPTEKQCNRTGRTAQVT